MVRRKIKKTEEFADETDDRKAEHLVCQSRLYRGQRGDCRRKGKDGPLGEYFSHTLSDPMCGQESWEEGESELQLATAKLALQKANVRPEQIRMILRAIFWHSQSHHRSAWWI